MAYGGGSQRSAQGSAGTMNPGGSTGGGTGGAGGALTTRSTQAGSTDITTFGTVRAVNSIVNRVVDVTQGYFTNNAGLLEGNNIHTGTLADTNEDYYFNVTDGHPLSASTQTQFSVAFGHRAGSGSVVLAGNETPTIKGATQAIYTQFSTLLLPEGEISGGFQISNKGTSGIHYSTQASDDYIYVLVGNRERFKDGLDTKSWTIKLKGRDSQNNVTPTLSLTDDSDVTTNTDAYVDAYFGARYNIISGAAGVATSSINPAAHRTFGFYYPDAGVMVFSGAELSASIPGPSGSGGLGAIDTITASFSPESDDGHRISSSGFTPNLFDDGNPKNGLKFVNCLANIGTEDIRMRGIQKQNKKSIFCTAEPGDFNFSLNPTFLSGSEGKLRHKSMHGNPSTFITGIGLHDGNGTLVAVGKLSTPLIKNFGTQVTIKVNLTY
tara:strand:- start:74 stop:1384 length:1311 start_codon:yes stop_codon:yes gene_type:complete